MGEGLHLSEDGLEAIGFRLMEQGKSITYQNIMEMRYTLPRTGSAKWKSKTSEAIQNVFAFSSSKNTDLDSVFKAIEAGFSQGPRRWMCLWVGVHINRNPSLEKGGNCSSS